MRQDIINIGGQEIILETGEIAKQTNGAVIIRHKETVLLATVVAEAEARENIDFFPLTVEYREKTAACGKIPGGFIKRETRPQNHEILTSRIVDRSIRPLFPKNFQAETQVMVTVYSYDPETDTGPLAVMGAAAALQISDIPWEGPVCGLRLIRCNGEYKVLPPASECSNPDIDLVISCRKDGLIMLEGLAREASEKEVLDGIMFAQESMQPFFELMERWTQELKVEKRTLETKEFNPELEQKIKELTDHKLIEAILNPEKLKRKKNIKAVFTEVTEALEADYPEDTDQINAILGELLHNSVRHYMVENNKRIDGRDFKTIRPISGKSNWLPRNHGSALFTRGETQAIVSCTLGTLQDEQIVETLSGEERERFMLHYNFPPFCVGEARPLRGPGRREIGHGNLALRALINVIPSNKEFPYTIRLVSDITESNGSSSMASVCGGTLAMMDAGVPINGPVAGIAMGLIQEGDKIIILSDIMGDEDHLGDMDFKVTGSVNGITALQMDNKIGSLSSEVLQSALSQAREGRLHILGEMSKIIDKVRENLSAYAPRVVGTQIRKERIRHLIGPGGKHIQEIQDTCRVQIDIDSQTGQVRIYAKDAKDCQEAMKKVRYHTAELEVDKIYRGTVTSVKEFGAFVRIFSDTEGLVHISELANQRVKRVSDVVKEGEEVIVKVLGVDRQGKIRLSRREALNVEASQIEN